MTTTTTPTTTATPPAEPARKLPKLDLRAMLARLKLPDIDIEKLIDSRRKDVEALLAANERAFVALEALSRKQAELLTEVMKAWQASAKDVIADTGTIEKINQATAHAQSAFAHALTSMKEMAEIASKSGQDVLGILNKRYHEALEEFRASIVRKA